VPCKQGVCVNKKYIGTVPIYEKKSKNLFNNTSYHHLIIMHSLIFRFLCGMQLMIVLCIFAMQEGNTQLKDAEKSLSEAEKVEAVLLARDKESQDNLKVEMRRRQQVMKNIATDKGLLKKKENTLEKGREEYSTMEEKTTKLKESLKDARKRHQAASMGLFVDESGKATTLQQQLIGQ
jgi:hypothetical protein